MKEKKTRKLRRRDISSPIRRGLLFGRDKDVLMSWRVNIARPVPSRCHEINSLVGRTGQTPGRKCVYV